MKNCLAKTEQDAQDGYNGTSTKINEMCENSCCNEPYKIVKYTLEEYNDLRHFAGIYKFLTNYC